MMPLAVWKKPRASLKVGNRWRSTAFYLKDLKRHTKAFLIRSWNFFVSPWHHDMSQSNSTKTSDPSSSKEKFSGPKR